MKATRDFRIGCGAGFSSDRLDPAVDLARRGRLDALVFECIGERTRSNVSVFAFDPANYEVLRDQLTDERLRRDLGSLLTGPVTRYELPGLAGLNFVMDDALEGGVNDSLNLDGHGKSWSSLLLGLEVTLP